MSVDRLQRLVRLLTTLQSTRARSMRDLEREFGVARRTLFRDLKTLGAAGVPVYHDPQTGYRLGRGFFLPPVDLMVSEALGLMLLGKTAAAQRGRPLLAPALSAISKLIAGLPDEMRVACADLLAHVTVEPGAAGVTDAESRFYPLLQRAIDEQRACRMRYRSPVEPEAACLLKPYALHFAGRAWYVLGACSLHRREVRIFKLARIQSLELTAQKFRRPPRFRPSDKIGQAWLLNPEGRLYDIEVEFSARVAVNVTEVRWHATQRQELLPDGRCRMTFQVDGLNEIAWWLCGYADQVVVLAPPELRAKVQGMLRAALQRYEAQDTRK